MQVCSFFESRGRLSGIVRIPTLARDAANTNTLPLLAAQHIAIYVIAL